jgi:small subunit ribosomal protein S20
VAHSRQARKRWRQNEARRARNKPVRTGARTAVKSARDAAGAGGDDAAAAVREAISILDRAAKRGGIHKNAASRQKSKLMRLVSSGGAPAAEAPAKKPRRTATKPAAKSKAPAKPRATRAKKTDS